MCQMRMLPGKVPAKDSDHLAGHDLEGLVLKCFPASRGSDDVY